MEIKCGVWASTQNGGRGQAGNNSRAGPSPPQIFIVQAQWQVWMDTNDHQPHQGSNIGRMEESCQRLLCIHGNGMEWTGMEWWLPKRVLQGQKKQAMG